MFPALDSYVIQNTYDLLNDADLTYNLMVLAFPNLIKLHNSVAEVDKVMSNLNKMKEKRQHFMENHNNKQGMPAKGGN